MRNILIGILIGLIIGGGVVWAEAQLQITIQDAHGNNQGSISNPIYVTTN